MRDSLEYIEAYFEKGLDEAGIRQFEQQCEQDEDFARDVALYITTRAAMKQALTEQKREQWRQLGDESLVHPQVFAETPPATLTGQAKDTMTASPAPVRKMAVRRWWPYAVAASVLLFAAIYFSGTERSLRKQIASNIEEELQPPSPKMGPSDTMELGKTAYKNAEYDRALQLYGAVLEADSTQDQALLGKGRTFLAQKNYDSALYYFDKLSVLKLHSNSGPYDAALTLLERNRQGDREKAKQLLQKVVADSLEGNKQAQGLLKLMQ